jgi:hypothetical protein
MLANNLKNKQVTRNILIFILCSLNYTIHAQTILKTSGIDIEFNNISIQEAIKQLGELTELNFVINASNINTQKRLTKNFTNANLEEILAQLFSDQYIICKSIGNHLVITAPSQEPKVNAQKDLNSFSFYFSNEEVFEEKEKEQEIKSTSVAIPDSLIENIVLKSIENERTIAKETIIERITIYDTVFVTKKDTLVHYDTILVKRNIKRAKFDRRLVVKNNISAEFGISGSANMPGVSSTSNNPESIQLIEVKKADSYGIGIDGRINFQYQNITTQIGVGLQIVSDNYGYTTRFTDTYFESDTFAYQDDSIGHYTYFIYQRRVDSTVVFKADKGATYYYFQIPLYVGYNFDLKKFSIEPKVGVNLEYLFRSTGSILHVDSSAYSELKNENYISNRPNISLVGAVHASYKFNNSTSIFVEPYFSYQFRSIYNSQLWYEQRYKLLGIRAGIRIKLK